jgi:hypothetical protein
MLPACFFFFSLSLSDPMRHGEIPMVYHFPAVAERIGRRPSRSDRDDAGQVDRAESAETDLATTVASRGEADQAGAMQIEPGGSIPSTRSIPRTAMKKWRGIAAVRDGGGGSMHGVTACGS